MLAKECKKCPIKSRWILVCTGKYFCYTGFWGTVETWYDTGYLGFTQSISKVANGSQFWSEKKRWGHALFILSVKKEYHFRLQLPSATIIHVYKRTSVLSESLLLCCFGGAKVHQTTTMRREITGLALAFRIWTTIVADSKLQWRRTQKTNNLLLRPLPFTFFIRVLCVCERS